ncbi:unnamed protein product [Alopecurus aequalis]
MSRGGSAGGGQSSLSYLFGGSEPPKPAVAPAAPAAAAPPARAEALPAAGVPTEKMSPVKGEVSKQIPAGIPGSQTNNYQRADGQNTGNFLTDRPSTKVHAAPGGKSSLDYLFGGKN